MLQTHVREHTQKKKENLNNNSNRQFLAVYLPTYGIVYISHIVQFYLVLQFAGQEIRWKFRKTKAHAFVQINNLWAFVCVWARVVENRWGVWWVGVRCVWYIHLSKRLNNLERVYWAYVKGEYWCMNIGMQA